MSVVPLCERLSEISIEIQQIVAECKAFHERGLSPPRSSGRLRKLASEMQDIIFTFESIEGPGFETDLDSDT